MLKLVTQAGIAPASGKAFWSLTNVKMDALASRSHQLRLPSIAEFLIRRFPEYLLLLRVTVHAAESKLVNLVLLI